MRKRNLLVLLAVLLVATPAFSQQKKTLTIDDIYDPQKKIDFTGTVPQPKWTPDGESYVVPSPEKVGMVRVDASSGRSSNYLDTGRIELAFVAVAGFNQETARAIARRGSHTFNPAWNGFMVEHANDLYYYDTQSNKAWRLTSAPGKEENPTFSPDGRFVAFTRANDLHVVAVADATERRLTTDGGPMRLNGKLDWVYEEELYGRGQTRAFWWSPDSTAIAYLSTDESPVPAFVITEDVVTDQVVEHTTYPQAGDPNPHVKVGVVSAAGGDTTWMDLSAYQPADTLIVRVSWAPDSKRVLYQVQNRIQNWLELVTADARTVEPRSMLREQSTAWVEVIDPPEYLPDGSFVWQSDRTGFRHLYHYSADGRLLKPITAGEWDVRALHGVSRDGWIYFSAYEHSPIATHVYRVKVDGTGMQRITSVEGNHTVSFNPQHTMFVDYASTVAAPAQTRLVRADGTAVRVLEENKVAAFNDYAWGAVEFMKVPTRDGVMLEAMMIKPPNFDPSKRYPVLQYAYSGPGAQSVRDAWGGPTYLWHQMLAQKGYLIWVLDNRTASAKGVRSAHPIYRNAGELELRDHEDGVAWLKKQPYVDGSRIGIWGWSYGGYMASYALTHSDVYKVGIAGAPVTDWRLYDSIYTERFMGLPGDNKAGYDKSSVLLAAGNLKGKLLLIHGAIDDNVHMQNSIKLIDALQKAGKQFDFMIYPQSRHGVTDPARVKHLRQMMADYVVNNL